MFADQFVIGDAPSLWQIGRLRRPPQLWLPSMLEELEGDQLSTRK